MLKILIMTISEFEGVGDPPPFYLETILVEREGGGEF